MDFYLSHVLLPPMVKTAARNRPRRLLAMNDQMFLFTIDRDPSVFAGILPKANSNGHEDGAQNVAPLVLRVLFNFAGIVRNVVDELMIGITWSILISGSNRPLFLSPPYSSLAYSKKPMWELFAFVNSDH